jgi:hypothetical protein
MVLSPQNLGSYRLRSNVSFRSIMAACPSQKATLPRPAWRPGEPPAVVVGIHEEGGGELSQVGKARRALCLPAGAAQRGHGQREHDDHHEQDDQQLDEREPRRQ